MFVKSFNEWTNIEVILNDLPGNIRIAKVGPKELG